ncbi:MAG: OmpA family protein [Flavobacteriaceae bacterium]
MKKLVLITSALLMWGMQTGEAQVFKKLKKRAERAAERTVERRVEKETSKKTDQVLDSILEPGKKPGEGKGGNGSPIPGGGKPTDGSNGQKDPNLASPDPDPEDIKIYSKFDFVPGDKLLFFDDFSSDFIGDFPSKWNTNGGGELVKVNESENKWLELKPGYGIVYIPDAPDLPEEYTIEFDLLATGLDRQTSSTAVLKVGVSDDPSFKWGKFANVDIPMCQYAPVGFFVRNGGAINTKIDGDIRDKVLKQPHISIAVNKQRFRLWVDESKYVDIPRMIPEGSSPKNLKLELRQMKDGKERLFISNIKIAKGGLDLRRTLISDGRVSTNGILFASGSATIQPQSMGIIRQISQVLQQEQSMQLNIIGHTDADGDDAANMALSERRAEAVKNVLVNIYNIDASRLSSEGKGESVPIGDNNTVDGKAKNRRVEFVKK